MRRASALLRAAFLWTLPMFIAILLWGPMSGLASGGPLQIALVVLFAVVVVGSLVRAAVDMTRDLWSGSYDERRKRDPAPITRQRSRRGLLLSAALVGGSLVATLTILELAFRLFLPQPLYAIELTPWGLWHMRSICLTHASEPRNEGSLLRGTEFVTRLCYNSWGMREAEHPVVKPPGELRVVVLGDSYGEAIEVEADRTAPKILQRMLNDALPQLRTRPRTDQTAPLRDASSDSAAEATPVEPSWPLTRTILLAIRDQAADTKADLLVANVHSRDQHLELRRRFFDASRIAWVDLAAGDGPQYHFRYDGHWNEMGHERAARLMFERIASGQLLPVDDRTTHIEVLNASMSASSQCKMLMVYREVAKRFDPDLVIYVYTNADERNLADSDVCTLEPTGTLSLHTRSYSTIQVLAREIRGAIRSRSHFGAWALDRIDEIPFFAGLRRQLSGQPDVPFMAPYGGP